MTQPVQRCRLGSGLRRMQVLGSWGFPDADSQSTHKKHTWTSQRKDSLRSSSSPSEQLTGRNMHDSPFDLRPAATQPFYHKEASSESITARLPSPSTFAPTGTKAALQHSGPGRKSHREPEPIEQELLLFHIRLVDSRPYYERSPELASLPISSKPQMRSLLEAEQDRRSWLGRVGKARAWHANKLNGRALQASFIPRSAVLGYLSYPVRRESFTWASRR